MRQFLLFRSTLLLVLIASVSVAKVREPIERTLILSEHPRTDGHKVYVGGRISTVLRFEKPCDPERTKLLAWEGRFEPLLCGGKSVVLYPLNDLSPQDRFMLLVTLTDGTEIPFTVTAHRQSYSEREIDQQVNVFADRAGYDAVLSSLYRALKSERELREENERYRKEENSIEPWTFGEARLSFDGSARTARPFALRMNRAEIIPGASGRIAVVADKSAFVSEQGLVDLTLEIFRGDGSQQVVVLLDHRLIRE